MNRSGECLQRVLQEAGLKAAAALVVVDDVSIPLGALRMRCAAADPRALMRGN